MSFWRIEDHKKRDGMVEDYVSTMKRLKEIYRQEKTGDTFRHQELVRHFEPVVQSNERMVKEIKKHLEPIKQELTAIKTEQPAVEYGTLAKEWKRKVLTHDPDVDLSFGIRFEGDGNTYMGDKLVEIHDDDLIVDNELYEGTPSLWKLITGKHPGDLEYEKSYTSNDLIQYYKLIRQTNVLYHDFDPGSAYPRANNSYKWKHLLNVLWNEFSKEGSGLQDPIKSCKMLIQKDGNCYRIPKAGEGLYLSSHPRVHEDGMWVKHGENVYKGDGLILGKNSPFKNIPILGWLL